MTDQPNPSPPNPEKRDPAAEPDMLEYRKAEGEYGAEQLEHLSDLEHVRERARDRSGARVARRRIRPQPCGIRAYRARPPGRASQDSAGKDSVDRSFRFVSRAMSSNNQPAMRRRAARRTPLS